MAYLNTYGGTSVLPGYRVAPISEDAFMSITYKKPSSVVSEAEKLQNIQQRKEMGLITQVEAIALDREIELEDAQEVYQRIQEESGREIERIMPTQAPPAAEVEDEEDELEAED